MALHSLKGVYNLRQFHMQSVDSFYKHSYSFLVTFKLMGCDATSFTGLENHGDDTKDSSQHMDAVCLIKTYEPQRFYNLFYGLEMVKSLESLPICTPILFTRPMVCFTIIRYQQIARFFFVTAST